VINLKDKSNSFTIDEFLRGGNLTEEEWIEATDLLYPKITKEELIRLYELGKTAEAQQYVKRINEFFTKIQSILADLDFSEAPPNWLIDQIRNGGRIVLYIHFSVPTYFRATPADRRLLFSLRHIGDTDVVIGALWKTALMERCSEEASRRISPVASNIADLIFLRDGYNNESYDSIMDKLRGYTGKSSLPQEKKTSEHQNEKNGELQLLLTEQIAKLRQLSVEDFFIQAMEKELDYLPGNVRNRFIDKIRTQAKEIQTDSLDEAKVKPDGSKVPMLEILTTEYEFLQTQPEEELPREDDPHDNLVEEIRAVYGDDVAETAKVYFEIYFQQDEPGEKVKQQQVARATGKNRKTISRHIPKIENFLKERMKKN